MPTGEGEPGGTVRPLHPEWPGRPQAGADSPSVTRFFGVVAVLSQGAGRRLTLAQLSSALKVQQSSLLSLLRPLVGSGLLVCEDGGYGLADRIYASTARWLAPWRFHDVVRPYMIELGERVEETVLLGVGGSDMDVLTYVEVIRGPRPVRYEIAPGTSRVLHECAAGRVFLAFQDAARRHAYLKSARLRRQMPESRCRAALDAELGEVAKHKLALSHDRYLPGLSAAAAPVFDTEGHCLAVLAVAGPTGRFLHDCDLICALLRSAAERASGLKPPFHT